MVGTIAIYFPYMLDLAIIWDWQKLSIVSLSHTIILFQVIDGLPAEFVLGKDGTPPSKAFVEAMPYTQSLLANGMAVGYHAKAAAPTVTMPRLKVDVIS